MAVVSLLGIAGSKDARTHNALIRDCLRDPFAGIGKPEPLKGILVGCWSRRIDHVHRLVYRTTASELEILACRYHYVDR